MIVEPEHRGWILRRLVRVGHELGLTESESSRADGRIPVAVGGDEGAMEMSHHAHFIANRRESRINRDPSRVFERESVCVADLEWGAALRDYDHAERAGLSAKPAAVVV